MKIKLIQREKSVGMADIKILICKGYTEFFTFEMLISCRKLVSPLKKHWNDIFFENVLRTRKSRTCSGKRLFTSNTEFLIDGNCHSKLQR